MHATATAHAARPLSAAIRGEPARRPVAKPKIELWQRIRIARTKAELTQHEVAKRLNDAGLKISRASITLWESPTITHRTHPSAAQIGALARVCAHGFSGGFAECVAFLHDDLAVEPAAPQRDGLVRAQAHWGVVMNQVMLADPSKQPCFNVRRDFLGSTFIAPFICGRDLVSFAHDTGEPEAVMLTREVGYLLVLERVFGNGKPMTKHLMLVTEGATERHLSDTIGKALGVNIVSLRAGTKDAEIAAKFLLSL
jgi:transcriptional regulator with XRE-family HTH domain